MSTRPEITSPTEFLGTTVEELESRLATNAPRRGQQAASRGAAHGERGAAQGEHDARDGESVLQHALELRRAAVSRVGRRGRQRQPVDMYDWVANIDLLSTCRRRVGGSSSPRRSRAGSTTRRRSTCCRGGRGLLDGKGKPPPMGWQGAVVALLGLYDKGKTFVLNHLTESKLPSGKKVSTKGSRSSTMIDGGTRFILLDSEGHSPVRVADELSVVEKETTELFLQELIFEMSDAFPVRRQRLHLARPAVPRQADAQPAELDQSVPRGDRRP